MPACQPLPCPSGARAVARPFTTTLISARPARLCAARAQQRSGAGLTAASQQRARAAQPLLPLLAGLGWAAPAGAEEAAATAADATAAQLSAAEQFAAAAAAAEPPTDPVISVLFTLAITALTVMTLGVGYLSFSSWMDSRTEQEDRKAAEGLRPVASGTGSGKQLSDALQEPKRAKKRAQEPASSKGFGKKK